MLFRYGKVPQPPQHVGQLFVSVAQQGSTIRTCRGRGVSVRPTLQTKGGPLADVAPTPKSHSGSSLKLWSRTPGSGRPESGQGAGALVPAGPLWASASPDSRRGGATGGDVCAGGVWLAHWVECVTHDLRVGSLSPIADVEIILKNKKIFLENDVQRAVVSRSPRSSFTSHCKPCSLASLRPG